MFPSYFKHKMLKKSHQKSTIFILLLGKSDDRDKLTVSFALDYWIKKGFPAHKIALGLATYGRAFRLKSADDHGLGAPKADWQNPPKGQFTREAGFLAYYEICNAGYTIVQDNKAGAPYGYKGQDWVGFENQASLVHKVETLIKRKRLSLNLSYSPCPASVPQ